MLSSLLPIFLLVVPVLSQEWTAAEYPNPRKGGFKECNMLSVSNVCDPDQILTQSERYRLNSELTSLSARTEEGGSTFCARKGVDSVLAIANEGSQKLANDLNAQWNLDGQCKRSVVFVLSASDRKLYFSGEDNSGISPAEFGAIVSSQEMLLNTGKFSSALGNIFKELGKKNNPVQQPYTPRPIRVKSSSQISAFLAVILSFLLAF